MTGIIIIGENPAAGIVFKVDAGPGDSITGHGGL